MTGIESSNYCSCVSNERRTEWRCGLDDAVPNTEDTDPTMLRAPHIAPKYPKGKFQVYSKYTVNIPGISH